MKPGPFNIDHFMTDTQTIARIVRPSELFSILTRRIAVPPECMAMVWGESGTPAVVAAGRPIEAEGCRKLLFVRTTPFEVNYEFTGLTSKDGFALIASVGLSVGVGGDRAEVLAFSKMVMGSAESVTPERLRQHCEPAVRAAVEKFVKGRMAADLVTTDAAGAFDALLAEEFKSLAFESGLVLASLPRFVAHSSDLVESQSRDKVAAIRQQRLDGERQQRERDRLARESHLTELSATLDRLHAMAAKSPGAGAVELIKTFSPAERGGLYQSLLARQVGTARTSEVIVVAGDEIITVDPNSPAKPLSRRALPSTLGPLRSVRTATMANEAVLLVGARTCVHVVKPDDAKPRSYAFLPERDLRGGVNAVVLSKDQLYATHSEVGLIRWTLEEPDQFELPLQDRLSGRKSVRDVQMDDTGRIWLAADEQVLGLSRESCEVVASLAAPANVTALLVADESVIAGLSDGQIVRWLVGAFDSLETLRPACGRAVESLGWLEGGGAARLLVGDRQPHLEMLVLGDAFSVEYRCGQQVRWGHASADWIIGVNDRRDQLILWRIDMPQEPERIVNIGQLCGHSIQDAGMVPGSQ